MRALRTPDAQFSNLPDYPFAPHDVSVPPEDGTNDELRVHYLDEGDPDAPAVLLMHGEPSWSFLYRRMIPALVDAGLRTIAPDLVGFGRYDKPAAREDFTYARHVSWMRSFLRAVDPRDVTLVGRTGAASSACAWLRPSRSGSRASSPRTPSSRRATRA